MISYLQAIVLGLLQGVTELFPVSSLGHSVLVPALLGWNRVLADQSARESPFLAFLVGLHVATALALLLYFRAEWARILTGLFGSARRRRVDTPDERLGWLLVVATIPAGLFGLAFEHRLRVLFARPLAAAAFLLGNGLLLLAGEGLRRRSAARERLTARLDPGRLRGQAPAGVRAAAAPEARLATLRPADAVLIGAAQILAFFAGISRSGVTMVAGLARGLDHEDAARFAFLLATPIILAAGVYKLPDLLGPNGDGVRGQVLAGSVAAAVAAWCSVRFLSRWFRTRTLLPFAVYCLLAGAACLLRFA
ncbi:MAG TPA: undecaprenyl-diphosphate phosphatase [Actinomycetes bacterium]|nr:undecaprenyl-diphosphate phosphatase [Actinomycetes bacterium]